MRVCMAGRCVPEGLRCNGDDDCGDASDELNCTKVFKACKEKTEEYYGIENLSKGWVWGGGLLLGHYFHKHCLYC